eukprot:501249_1
MSEERTKILSMLLNDLTKEKEFFSNKGSCNHLRRKQIVKSVHKNNWDTFKNYGPSFGSMCKVCAILSAIELYEKYGSTTNEAINRSILRAYASLEKYPNWTLFCFKKSDMWQWSLISSILTFKKCLNNKTGFIRRRNEFLRAMRWSLTFLMHYIHFIKWEHLQLMILKTEFFNYLLDIYNLEIKLKLEDDTTKINAVIWKSTLAIRTLLFAFLLDKFDKIRKNPSLVEANNNMQKKIIFLHGKIENLKITVNKLFVERNTNPKFKEKDSFRVLIYFTHVFLHQNNYRNCSKIIALNQKNAWREFNLTQQCIRANCQRTKGDRKKNKFRKFVKCSKCLVAIYCSRKCAKYDWIRGYHRKYCKRYADIANKNTLWHEPSI